jgi:hypothetical protein
MSWLLTWMMTWQRVNHVTADVANADVSIFWKWRQHMTFVNRPNSRLGTNWIAISAHLHFIHSPFTFHTQSIYFSYTAPIHFIHSTYTFQPQLIYISAQQSFPNRSKQKSQKTQINSGQKILPWIMFMFSMTSKYQITTSPTYLVHLHHHKQHHYQNTEAVYSVF